MPEITDGPVGATKTLALLAVCLSAISIPLAFTGPAVGIPAIADSLGGTPIALNWVTNAFMLAFGSFLMLAGTLADRYGRKRTFLIGSTAYAFTSAILALSQDIIWFDLLRVVQGMVGAVALSAGIAALAQEFEGEGRLRAFSFIGTSFGIGLAFGPILSGMLIDYLGWRGIFLFVVVFATLASILGSQALHESRDPQATSVDWAGAASFTAMLTAFTCAVLQAPDAGWSAPVVIGLLVAAAVLLGLFIWIEHCVARPMLDLSLFRYPRFIGVQLLALAPAYAFVVLLVLLPIRFIGIEGMSEIQAGQMMIALSGPLLILPVVAGFLTRRFAPATISGVGLLISAAGLFWLGQIPIGGMPLLPMLTIGVGISLPWGLMDGLAVSVVPKERAGMATGFFNTMRVAGEGVAVAVVSALLSGFITVQLAVNGSHAGTAAQLLATGDLKDATIAIPGIERTVLIASYGSGFATLMQILAVIAAFMAIVVFLFMGRGTNREEIEDIKTKESLNPESCL